MSWNKKQMADKVIELFTDNASVNLGIGLPTLIAERIPKEKQIMIHSENGVFGVSGRPTKETLSPTLINAGKETIAIDKGSSFFDSSLSFGMIRGGHIDFCVLGDESWSKRQRNGRRHGSSQWVEEPNRNDDSFF